MSTKLADGSPVSFPGSERPKSTPPVNPKGTGGVGGPRMEPAFASGGITVYHGDCLSVMAGLPDVAASVVMTDPPYGDHVHRAVRSGRMGGEHGLSDDVDLGFASITDETRAACAAQFARLSARWTIVFSDVESAHLWRAALEGRGLDYIRTLAWIKKGGGAPQFTGDRPAPGYEVMTLAHPPGKKRWNGGGRPGVYWFPTINRTKEAGYAHPTQKPLELMAQLIADFTDIEETILDPFAGSGTTLAAAYLAGRRAIGIEAQAEHVDAMIRRLTGLQSQSEIDFGDRGARR